MTPTESRPLAKVLVFRAREDAPRRPFGGDSRVLRFQTKGAYGWSNFMRKCREHNLRQARAQESMRARDDIH